MLNGKDTDIALQFKHRLAQITPVNQFVVFGSRARGEGEWDSDFDVCVVLGRLDAAADQVLSEIAWEVGFAHDRVITTIPFSRDQFERGPFSESALVQTIRREGVAA